MSVRPCSALCSALTVEIPPNPPPNTRMLLRALLHIAAAPHTCEVTCSDSTYPSPLTRQELHAACAPYGDSSRSEIPETIRCAPHQRPAGVGGVLAVSPPRHTRGHRALRPAATPHRVARTTPPRSLAPAARSCDSLYRASRPRRLATRRASSPTTSPRARCPAPPPR